MPDSTFQTKICERFGSALVRPAASDKLGIALATLAQLPVHALRLPPVGDHCGWYIWAGGEMSQEADFFQPLHVSHLVDYVPELIPYLALAPGWRVLLAPGQEDVWFQADLALRR